MKLGNIVLKISICALQRLVKSDSLANQNDQLFLEFWDNGASAGLFVIT